MAITSIDAYVASAKQIVQIFKSASRAAVAATPFSVFDLAGQPGAGTMAVGNTANGIVPTDATAGYPEINAFGAGNKGYLAGIQFGNRVECRLALYDTLFSAGAYAFNANTTLTSQPSFSGRVPNGTDYSNTELWLEAATAFTGSQSCAITYSNQAGTPGSTTGTVALGVAPTIGRMTRMPLQAGDTGVSKIESVVSTGSSAGTFNVHVMRRLWSGRVQLANGGDIHDLLRCGLVELFADSALRLVVIPDSTATSFPELQIEIANG